MKISVMTACYNAAATIRYTLDSFVAQTHANKELLVIDGDSTDETVAIAQQYAGEDVSIFSEPDGGIYDAMNKGLDRFTGDAVGFLNADDRFADRRCLSHIASALQGADIVYGHLNFVSDHESARTVRKWRASPHRPGAFKAGWMPAHPTFYVRRAVAEAVGCYDASYSVAADYDYMLRALELHRFRSRLVDEVLVEMRYGGASTRSLAAYMRSNLEALRSRQSWLGSGPVDQALLLKPLRKIAQFAVRRARLGAGSVSGPHV